MVPVLTSLSGPGLIPPPFIISRRVFPSTLFHYGSATRRQIKLGNVFTFTPIGTLNEQLDEFLSCPQPNMDTIRRCIASLAKYHNHLIEQLKVVLSADLA